MSMCLQKKLVIQIERNLQVAIPWQLNVVADKFNSNKHSETDTKIQWWLPYPNTNRCLYSYERMKETFSVLTNRPTKRQNYELMKVLILFISITFQKKISKIMSKYLPSEVWPILQTNVEKHLLEWWSFFQDLLWKIQRN